MNSIPSEDLGEPTAETSQALSQPSPQVEEAMKTVAELLNETEKLQNRKDELLRELDTLQADIAAAIAAEKEWDQQRELRALFPDLDPGTLPDEVLQAAKDGLPLSAAYALYHCRKERREQLAKAEEEKNRTRSSGAVSGGTALHGGFTLEEIATMSRSEVRKNYKDILRSLAGGHRSES